jgi:arylsulfatase
MLPAQAQVGEFLASFRKYPPRQAAASFTIDQVMDRLTSSIGR